MNEVIRELGELVEDDVVRITRELGALVVDFLDVAFGAGRANDIGRIADPVAQPIEPLAAHAGGQHRDAATAQDARNGDAAAAVVAGRRPDRPVRDSDRIVRSRASAPGRRKRPAPCARRSSETACRSGRSTGASMPVSSLRKDEVRRNGGASEAVRVVEPMDPPEIRRVGGIRVDRRQIGHRVEPVRFGQLAPGWQRALSPAASDRWLRVSAHSRQRWVARSVSLHAPLVTSSRAFARRPAPFSRSRNPCSLRLTACRAARLLVTMGTS